MIPDLWQTEEASKRFDASRPNRTRNERLIRERRFLEADTPQRIAQFLERRGVSAAQATRLVARAGQGVPETTGNAIEWTNELGLERVLGTSDLMGIAFLERGLAVSRSVGRIWMRVLNGHPTGFGTGFLVSPRLMLTNHHVLGRKEDARSSLVEFDYQLGLSGAPLASATFTLLPDEFHLADQGLDYALVAVAKSGTLGRDLATFGWNPLLEAQGKAIISQWVNIIQHPNGEPKQLALRENQIVELLDDFVQYKTDTAPGSSGAPVFNDQWEVVALHHSGVYRKAPSGEPLTKDNQIWRPEMGEHRIDWIANEGARVSRILAHLRGQAATLSPTERALLEECLAAVPPRIETSSPIQAILSGPQTPPRDPTVHVGPKCVASCTIPLTVSVQLGCSHPSSVAAPVPAPANPPVTPLGPPTARVDLSENEILRAARSAFESRDDVLNVELGRVFKDGWITDERAIVVTVRRKLPLESLRTLGTSPLPEEFHGLPIEVTAPGLADVLRVHNRVQEARVLAGEATTLRSEITYTPPLNVDLGRVTEQMRVIAHLSPDAGFTQLGPFLKATKRRLVVGMYDFGAPHILEAVKDATKEDAFQKLTLVMQQGQSVGQGTKADDLTDQEVVNDLSTALGAKFENAWVKKGPVNGWISSSYHIKVAVRDREAFWLSSGNWQSSNQPDADPITEAPQERDWLTKYNREWHAIVEHAGLAKTFEAHLLHDYQNNIGIGLEEALQFPDVFVPLLLVRPTVEEAAAPFQYFAPFDDDRVFTVTPLLTPDNYHDEVLKLLESAQSEILFQNQTLNHPKDGQTALETLVDALLMKQRAGVRVRIIFRVYMPKDARDTLTALVDRGFDADSIKVQKNCHTKGMIVDGKKVLLGSQNWSNDGVSVNRDASLLFEDEPLAQYFTQVFEHDWTNLARQNIGQEFLRVEFAPAEAATPPGMVRMTWKEYLELA